MDGCGIISAMKRYLLLLTVLTLIACTNKPYPFYTIKQSRRFSGWDNITFNHQDSTYVHSAGFCSFGRTVNYGKWHIKGNLLICQTSVDVNNLQMLCDTVKDNKGALFIDQHGEFNGADITVELNDGKRFKADKFPVVMFKDITGVLNIDSFRLIFRPEPGLCCYRYDEFKTETMYPDTGSNTLRYSLDLAAVNNSLNAYLMDTTTFKISGRRLVLYYTDVKRKKAVARYISHKRRWAKKTR
jgi:hypothetical protein